MKKKIIVAALSIFIVSEIICIAGLCLCKGQYPEHADVSIREIPQQTVLYTIYRGRHYKINSVINQLYTLAKEKGISISGPASTCYLNSPVAESTNHHIIEIQIPVNDNAIEQAGSLGDMTDIKVIPAMKVAVAAKPEGCCDPTSVLVDLFTWINKKGYVVKGKMRQSYLNGKGNYNNLNTEFMIPVDKLTDNDYCILSIDPCYM